MLRDTQIVFATSLLSGDAVVSNTAAPEIRAGKLSATRRLEIYRHNVYTNLRGVLKDIYPVIFAVVGEVFFHHAADQFVATHPSRSGDLNQFGGEWAAFLGTYPHAMELPYLSDVARLEWAWHQAFHAGNGSRLDLARLAAISAEQHAALRLVLHPAVRLVKSGFPVLGIWEVNQPGFAGEMAVDWDAPADSLMVHRDGVAVLITRIAEAKYAFLHALEQHATLETATAVALELDPAFDLQGFLLESVQSGIISDFKRE